MFQLKSVATIREIQYTEAYTTLLRDITVYVFQYYSFQKMAKKCS